MSVRKQEYERKKFLLRDYQHSQKKTNLCLYMHTPTNIGVGGSGGVTSCTKCARKYGKLHICCSVLGEHPSFPLNLGVVICLPTIGVEFLKYLKIQRSRRDLFVWQISKMNITVSISTYIQLRKYSTRNTTTSTLLFSLTQRFPR